MAWRVKRYLAADMLRIFDHCVSWRWEAERWTRQKERQGVVAQELPTPERPIRKNDHLMASVRYLCNELPEPVKQEVAPKTPDQAFWERIRARQKDAERTAKQEEAEGVSW